MEDPNDEDMWTPEETVKPIPLTIDTAAFLPVDVILEQADEKNMIETIEAEGVEGLDTDDARKHFNKLLLDNVSTLQQSIRRFETDKFAQADDFIHVLSLKGSMLYCSPSAARILEYDPSYVLFVLRQESQTESEISVSSLARLCLRSATRRM